MLIRHNNIEFVNAQAMHSLHPGTFDVPTAGDLQALRVGNWVKVCVNNERFWCVVTDISEGIITGRVDNNLLQDGLQCGDVIQFPTDCIYDIM